MERKNTGQLSLACTGNLRDNRQPRRLGSVLPSSNAIIMIIINTDNDNDNVNDNDNDNDNINSEGFPLGKRVLDTWSAEHKILKL